MTHNNASAHLGSTTASSQTDRSLLQRLLSFEAWLDRRTSRWSLYRLDDRSLADIGLSRADIEGLREPLR